MNQATALLAGAGLGAGLMYFLDPDRGRSRRTWLRDKAIHAAHEAEDAACVVGRDLRNRSQGLVAEASSQLRGEEGQGGSQRSGTTLDLFQKRWSPSTRFLVGATGLVLTVYGLTKQAPTACVLGIVGLGMFAEGLTDFSVSDWTYATSGGSRQSLAGQGTQQPAQAPRQSTPAFQI